MKRNSRSRIAIVLAVGLLATTTYLLKDPLGVPAGGAGAAGPKEAQSTLVPHTVQTPVGPVLTHGNPEKHVADRNFFASSWDRSPRDEISTFARWAKNYIAGSPEARISMLSRGLEVAGARRALMLRLIKEDPREAIANTPPVKVRQQLPAEVQALLETRVSALGKVFRVRGVAGPGDKTVISTIDQADLGGKVFQAHRYGDRELTPDLTDVSIHGIELDGHLAILDSPVRRMEEGETPELITDKCVVTGGTVVAPPDPKTNEVPKAEITTMLVGNHGYELCCPFCGEDFETRMERLERTGWPAIKALQAISDDADEPRSLSSSGVNGSLDYPGKPPQWLTHGTNTMIMMRVDFPDYPYCNFSEQYLRDQINGGTGVAPMINRFSYGKSQVADPTITPILRMPRNRATYDNGLYWGDILNDARNAAIALGYNPDTFACRVIVHEGFVSGNAAGWGGGGAIWCNGNASERLLVHEYGHVFWLPHANSWHSTDGDPLSANRTHLEYGDVSDPMGNAWGTSILSDYNAYYKNLMGWLPDSAVVPVTHSGTYRINQFDGMADLTKPVALKITRDNGLDLWVMFRGDPVPQNRYNEGAYIVAVNGERFGDSHVLDFNSTAADTVDAPLSQAQSWTDSASGITITTAGRMMTDSPHHLYVKVDFGPNYTHGYRQLVSGGIYAFRNKSFNQFLTVPNNSTASGIEPIVYGYTGIAEQQWVAQRNSDGTYSFKHNGTDKFLDVLNNGAGDGEEIIQWTGNGLDSQRWDILNSWDGYLKLRHRGTDQLLTADTAGGNYGDIIQFTDFSGDEQKWEPQLLGINNGTHRLVPRHAQTMAMALRGRSKEAGTRFEQQFWAGGDWQRWATENLGSGQFRIYPVGQPGLSLTIPAGSMVDGTKATLEAYTGTAFQKFTFTSTGMGFVRLTPVHAPAMCIDVSASGTSSGVDIQQWTYLGGNNQQWRFIDSDL